MQFNPWTSKAMWGGIIAALGMLLTIPQFQQYADIINAVSKFLEATGGLLFVYGTRHAIAKASQGIAQLHPFTLVIALLFGAIASSPVPSPMPLEFAFADGDGYCTSLPNGNLDCFGAINDSLKYVLAWKQPPDTVLKGKIDSTVFNLRASKPATWYNGTAITPGVNVRRVKTTFSDSFKLAKPVLGDSAIFMISGFMLCRKGDCSVPGSAGWTYRETYAPPPAVPTIRIETF